jgi:hypothetical protein
VSQRQVKQMRRQVRRTLRLFHGELFNKIVEMRLRDRIVLAIQIILKIPIED